MGDTGKHLTYFKVENFKRFESFEMKDLGQFNLIVGDNNVGKTSVLEALLAGSPSRIFLNRLFVSLRFRNIKENFIYKDLEFYLNKRTSSNLNSIVCRLTFGEGKVQTFRLDFNQADFLIQVKDSNDLQTMSNSLDTKVAINLNLNTPFIPFYKGHDQDLTNFYSRLQENRSVKKSFIKSLNIIVPDLEDIELSSPQPDSRPNLIVYQKHSDSSLPLAMFGDGTLKLFRLLAEIVLNKGERLMIDEIDTGIHFSRFKRFWNVILQSAKDNDVQLFMTTHNEECLKYFKEVINEELPEFKNDVRNITLVENAKTKVVTAHTDDFEQFEHAINVGNEIRA